MKFIALINAVVIGLAVLYPIAASASDKEVDLELVLAVDASGSIDADEYRLQLDGIASALMSPDIIEAVKTGPLGQIALAMVVWAEAEIPGTETSWALIRSSEDLGRFANLVRNTPRQVNGGTGIGAGLAQGMRMLERNGFTSLRQVVDVSGDGAETPPRNYVVLIDTARGMALSRGVTINGLAIENEDPDLEDWYRRNVATGPGSFVMSVANFGDFQEAMRRKLVKEITWNPKIGTLKIKRSIPIKR